jgi:zinc transporter ZupT
LESSGNTALEGTCTDVNSGGTITAGSTCYRLVFDDSASQSTYTIDASGASNIAFFTEHFPTEFENTDHYLKDTSGTDIEPDAYLPGYEWAGIFNVAADNTYMWTAQKTGTSPPDYADATMKIAVITSTAGTEAALHSAEVTGRTAVQLSNCPNVQAGGVITPTTNAVCYNLVFKSNWWQSLYSLDATGVSYVSIFAQHVPTEFENTAHYLKDDHGDDIEPIAELPEASPAAAPAPAPAAEEEKYWGEGILASIIVNIMTLCGVIFLIPGINTAAKKYREEFECVLMAFAGGAISAAAFFLLLYESTHLIATQETEETEQIWRWGSMILAGALFPTIVHGLSEIVFLKPTETGKGGDAEEGGEALKVSRLRLISSVLIGDFMHNLCDGFFVGAAFKGCGSSFAWTVTWSTVAHEIAQELGDYLVLTGSECRISPAIALVFNFLSGTGMLWGTLIVLGTDVSDYDIGMMLSFGGGVYLNIAFIECMARFQTAKVSGKVRLFGVFMFCVGATAIGLVLLKHEHCVPPPPAGAPPPPPGGGGHHNR